jgi:hypothetical protein
MKKIFLVAACILSANALFSENPAESFLSKRFDFYIYNTSQETLAQIHAFRESAGGLALAEEERLSLENLLLLEELNFSGDSDAEKKRLYPLLNEQSLKNGNFLNGKRIASLSVIFLVSCANIKVRILEYLPAGQAYGESMAARDLYLQALRKDRRSSYALANYALWLYFAPPIAGGGYDPALKTMSRALNYATDKKEKYFILVYRSQIFFAMKRKNDCAGDLAQARSLFPAGNFTEIAEELNEKNKSLFD